MTELSTQIARRIASEINGGERPDCSYPPELVALLDDPAIENEEALAQVVARIIKAELAPVMEVIRDALRISDLARSCPAYFDGDMSKCDCWVSRARRIVGEE